METSKGYLKIKFEDIPPEGLEVPFEDAEGLLVRDCFPVKAPIKGRVFLNRWGAAVKVRGHVETVVVLTCDRCAENFSLSVSETIDIELHPVATLRALQEEVRLSREDLDVSFFDGETIEVDEIIREQILLAVPMRKLCREDCKGLPLFNKAAGPGQRDILSTLRSLNVWIFPGKPPCEASDLALKSVLIQIPKVKTEITICTTKTVKR
jgi:uncharacterized protein